MPSNFEDELPTPVKKPKLNIMTPKLVAALDRTGTTPRQATYILTAATEALGIDVNEVNLSRSTVQRARVDIRKDVATQLKSKLKVANILVLHWDGKLLPDNEKSGKIERLPIIITGLNTEQLLAVPKLSSGTGKNCADAIIAEINNWGISDRVKALCFDTTSSNTGQLIASSCFIPSKLKNFPKQCFLNLWIGRLNGTCAILEKELGRDFLYLACRHHVLELVLRSVVETYWKVTSGPNMAIFQRFQKKWDEIDKNNFKTGMEDEECSRILEGQKDNLLDFISTQFKVLYFY